LNPPSVAAAIYGVAGLHSRSYGAAIKSISHLGYELFLYACKVKETANGCWRCARG